MNYQMTEFCFKKDRRIGLRRIDWQTGGKQKSSSNVQA